MQVETVTTNTDELDAKDVFEELDEEQQNAVNTALKASITVGIKYREENSEFAVDSGKLYTALAVQKNTALYQRRQT